MLRGINLGRGNEWYTLLRKGKFHSLKDMEFIKVVSVTIMILSPLVQTRA